MSNAPVIKETVLIGISGIDTNKPNYYGEMVNMKKDDGTPLFQTVEMKIKCKKCWQSAHDIECTHGEYRISLGQWQRVKIDK